MKCQECGRFVGSGDWFKVKFSNGPQEDDNEIFYMCVECAQSWDCYDCISPALIGWQRIN